MWDEEIGSDRGLYQVNLRHWTYGFTGSTLEEYAGYIATVVANGGEPVVKMIGTPEELSNYTDVYWNFHAYPPENLSDWQDFIYDELKYIVVENEVVNNSILFNDNDNHSTLGLGDDMLFSLWYGIWGIDPFQFRGNAEEFFALWNATYEAALRLENDYGVNIKLGGFGFGQINDSLWDFGEFDGYNGFVYDFINYSHDPNRDGDDSDRIPIDWIEYQWRHTDPFSISDPGTWRQNPRGQIKAYLEMFGYSPDILVMAAAWHTQNRIFGLNDSFGRPFETNIEDQNEIDAAYAPAMLYDMELAGQKKQFRETIQDFAEDNTFPLFRGTNGGISTVTLGLESEDYLGLKKANFNALKLIDMLGDVKLFSTSDKTFSSDNYTTVNVYATKNSTDNSLQILLWNYVSPKPYLDDNIPYDKVDYNYLYQSIYNEFGGEYININLTIDGLNFNNYIDIETYLIDQNHSNSFTYRNEICSALNLTMDDKGCVENFSYERVYTIREINNWKFGNNPYNVSVDLEKTSDYVINNTDHYTMSFNLQPYSVMLITMSSHQTTCGDDICSEDESCSSCPADCGSCPSGDGNGSGDGGGGPPSGGGTPPPEECQEGDVQSCGLDIGICQPGTQTCINGEWSECEGAINPLTEVCNNEDDDCDGLIDDDIYCECLIGETKECGSNVGECSSGFRLCADGVWDEECINEIKPSEEICNNNLDEDCDGVIDNPDTCLQPTEILTCQEGPIPEQGCKCGDKTYSSGYCYNNIYTEEAKPPFPWIVLSIIGVMIVTITLIVLIVKKVFINKEEVTMRELIE
jgi:hypothetical protein